MRPSRKSLKWHQNNSSRRVASQLAESHPASPPVAQLAGMRACEPAQPNEHCSLLLLLLPACAFVCQLVQRQTPESARARMIPGAQFSHSLTHFERVSKRANELQELLRRLRQSSACVQLNLTQPLTFAGLTAAASQLEQNLSLACLPARPTASGVNSTRDE